MPRAGHAGALRRTRSKPASARRSYAPTEADIHQNIGYSYSRLGNHGEAIAAYQKAIELAPESAAPYAGAAAAYFAQRNWAKAEEFYRMAVARDPKNRAAWQALGDAAGEQGKSAEAIAAYRKAQELGPAGPGCWAAWAGSSTTSAICEAEAVLRDANRMNPTDVRR